MEASSAAAAVHSAAVARARCAALSHRHDPPVRPPHAAAVSPLAHPACAAVEGWIVFVTGVHEEAQEDDVLDKFSEFGEVKNINLNLDRRTGFVKEAEAAIAAMNGAALLGQPVKVSWAFVKEDGGDSREQRRSSHAAGGGAERRSGSLLQA